MSDTKAVTDLDSEIGLVLKRYRILAGFSQSQLSEKLGFSYQQLHKYERGYNRVSAARLCVICEALDVSPGDVLREALETKAQLAGDNEPSNAGVSEPRRAVLELSRKASRLSPASVGVLSEMASRLLEAGA